MQRVRLAIRGWMRRREGDAEKRNAEFLRRNAGWGTSPEASLKPAHVTGITAIDLEGLQVAYLDDSGRMEHFLDSSSGEVIDIMLSDPDAIARARGNAGWRKVPRRSDESEGADRAAFVEEMEPGSARNDLRHSLSGDDAAKNFRKLIARDRAIERAWYNFKNDRATEAIEAWLATDCGRRRPS